MEREEIQINIMEKRKIFYVQYIVPNNRAIGEIFTRNSAQSDKEQVI